MQSGRAPSRYRPFCTLYHIRHGRADGRLSQSPRQLIANSGLFDADYYRVAYLDVALPGQDPFEHYINCGLREGRSPSFDFDSCVYLANNPDLQGTDIDPIIHYIKHGRAEGRVCRSSSLNRQQLPEVLAQIRSTGVFDDEFYLRHCPAVRDAGVDPLLHYVIAGFANYVDPSPTISTIQYIIAHPQARATGPGPLFQLNSAIAINDDGHFPMADPSCTSTEEPARSITIERMAGGAYFHRFLFPFHSVDIACKYVAEDVADLVCRSPELKVERIDPDVSIIIPVYGQLHYVLNCLDSLSRQRSRFSAEIIVADDSSPESSETWRLQAIPWIRYRLHEPNGGFLDTCNDVARVARGRFLVFLNSDTRVAEGWLDELIDSFTTFPKAGLIGSALFNADGSLQEAGGSIGATAALGTMATTMIPITPNIASRDT